MKTVVINTSKEAKNTKLDILFKAPFDQNGLLWIDSELNALGENALQIKESLINRTDMVDRDYQLIVLVDLYAFPLGNDKKAVGIYQMLVQRYVMFQLVEKLHSELNLSPRGVSLYFVDSAKTESGLDLNLLDDNSKQQEKSEALKHAQMEAQEKKMLIRRDGDLSDEAVCVEEPRRGRTEQQRILMNIFSWTEGMKNSDFRWDMKISVTGDETIDFSEVFYSTAFSIKKSHKTAEVLDIALQEVLAPLEVSQLSSVGRFPIHSLVCFVSRENEQSKLEGFFCLFANIFSCVQEKKLFAQLMVFDKDEIRTLLIAALKKYKHFSAEENIKVEFEPITKIFERRTAIYERRKKEARSRSEFKDKSDEEVAQIVMSEKQSVQRSGENRKLHGLDRTFHDLAEDIFSNYDENVIRAQNNRIVKSCLEGLWDWRDKQTSESFKGIVDAEIALAGVEDRAPKRDKLAFIEEEYEAKRDELINKVTDAENKLAANKNILLETKDLVLKYGDWMRKGKWYWISFIGAVFTVLATVFPFFYTDYSIGNVGLSFWVNLPTVIGYCAAVYAVAASIYIAYINRKKLALIHELETLRDKSEEERKASIIALYRYYNDTVVEAESHCLLWREILRRDRENAKKGIKRNYHIKRLKSLAEQVERFITMLKIDAGEAVIAGPKDLDEYAQMGLRINGEASFYEQENRRVYCFLPEKDANQQPKGGTEEA